MGNTCVLCVSAAMEFKVLSVYLINYLRKQPSQGGCRKRGTWAMKHLRRFEGNLVDKPLKKAAIPGMVPERRNQSQDMKSSHPSKNVRKGESEPGDAQDGLRPISVMNF